MKTVIISLKIFFFFTLLTGIIYPIFITGIGQLFFPYQANGSLLMRDGNTIGSELIGQKSDTLFYFSSRPSAISYNPMPSGGSNFGLTNLRLKDTVAYRKRKFLLVNQLDSMTEVPPEMLFASASGLDPHISQRAALLQVDRISKIRGFNPDQKDKLIKTIQEKTQKPQFGMLGEFRVNVLLLNLELDRMR